MLKEAITSVADNFKERASSPILGSYTVAALACNWKSIVILLTSQKTGTDLVSETAAAFPGLIYGILIPVIFAITFSLLYPTIKASIAAFNTRAKIMELQSEYRMEEWKEKVSAKRSDVESVISAITDLTNRDMIGYHDLKRIYDALPNPQELEIKRS